MFRTLSSPHLVAHDVTDEQPDPETILGRMVHAGIDEQRAREHLQRGVVRLRGDVVTDPEAAAPWPARWVVGPQG